MVERTQRKTLTVREKAVVWNRSNGLCVICQASGLIVEGHEYDHIIPLAYGGSNDIDNFQLLCVPCHKNKSAEEKGHKVRGSCEHGYAYSGGYRCKECPPSHKYWQRAERQGLTTQQPMDRVDFSGPISEHEDPNLIDRRARKKWVNRTQYRA